MTPFIRELPSAKKVRTRLAQATREVELLRWLLRIAGVTDEYRSSHRHLKNTKSGRKSNVVCAQCRPSRRHDRGFAREV